MADLEPSPALRGSAWCRARSALVDAWLRRLLAAAHPGGSGVALVAIGGYGRGELAPQSDLDLLLLHTGKADVGPIAEAVWYPIWDRGLRLGHTVATERQVLKLASSELDTATALLSARHVAGDEAVSAPLAGRAAQQWQDQARRWLPELGARVDERHERFGDVAFLLEPDLKEGRGGLRDVHALGWAQQAREVVLPLDQRALAAAGEVLLAARVALGRRTGRKGDVLLLEEQDGVGADLGLDADGLMAEVAQAGRTIGWTSDDTWRRLRSSLRGPVTRNGGRPRPLGGGLALVDGEVALDGTRAPADDPLLALRAAAAAAEEGTVVQRRSLERLAAEAPPVPVPWPAEARPLLVRLLSAGHAIDAIEALDHRGLWQLLLPEWEAVRCRPQRNAYHRFTVDRHLLEAVAGAAGLVDRVDRPDLLVLGTLLHDLGKGRGRDHTEVGVELAADLGVRMGLPPEDVADLVAMVEHHLLLPDVATRRDLDDPATIERVAGAVGTRRRLHLLAALTEADSRATGPAAWGSWKAGLVRSLVDRVDAHLAGRPGWAAPADEAAARRAGLLRGDGTVVTGEGDVLTVATDDRPGVLSRVAGVLALHGIEVLSATALSEGGRAVAELVVADPRRDAVPWDRVVDGVERALAGRLALDARLAERARGLRVRATPPAAAASVTFHPDASSSATVIDVHAPDGLGVLYRITCALASLDLDIRSARVQTLGHEVVDAFYVTAADGSKLVDRDHQAEVEKAILHRLV